MRDTPGLNKECLEKELCLLVMRGKGFGAREEKALTGG